MDVQMCTSGKSIGSFGAFVLADDIIIEYLINRARTFMYTTALPASALAASLTALKLIPRDTSYKEELWSAIDYMRTNLIRMGFDLKRSEGPIIPIVVGEDATALMIQNMLMKKGVFLQAIRPPTVPSGTSRLRLNVIRVFTRAEMDQALDGLLHAAKKVGLIG